GRGVVAVVPSRRARFGEARVLAAPAGGRGRCTRARVGARRGVAQALVGEVVRVRAPAVAVVDPEDRDGRVVDPRRLRRARPGEARQERALARDRGLRLARRVSERALGQLHRRLAHYATPTWTSRNRAGAAPCETDMTWPGSPLPQFVSPHARHSSGPQTASSEPQKRGPIPA